MDELSHGTNFPSITTRVRDATEGKKSRVKGFLVEFLTPILPKIKGEPTREGLIELYQLVSGNEASVSSNLGGGRHGHLAWTTTSKEYAAQTGFAFVPPHKPGN